MGAICELPHTDANDPPILVNDSTRRGLFGFAFVGELKEAETGIDRRSIEKKCD